MSNWKIHYKWSFSIAIYIYVCLPGRVSINSIGKLPFFVAKSLIFDHDPLSSRRPFGACRAHASGAGNGKLLGGVFCFFVDGILTYFNHEKWDFHGI